MIRVDSLAVIRLETADAIGTASPDRHRQLQQQRVDLLQHCLVSRVVDYCGERLEVAWQKNTELTQNVTRPCVVPSRSVPCRPPDQEVVAELGGALLLEVLGFEADH